jgi:hypothetical protein
MLKNIETILTKSIILVGILILVAGGVYANGAKDPSANYQLESEKYYLPQPEQVFDGKIETRIGELEFENQYPTKESIELLLDSMDFHGATQSFLWGIPIASFANFQYYLHQDFGFGQFDLMETKTLSDKLGILTANATTPYILCTPNLSETGPVVIEVPAGSIAGMVDDFWQRPITDIGLSGPDQGKGGKYLITPPGYEGEKPDDYFVFESPTNNIFMGLRIIEPDPDKYNTLKEGFRIYAYKDRADAGKSVYKNPPGKYFFGPPRGMAFWERLHEVLNREVVAERDRFLMAMLKRVGIEKGKPFNPTPRQIELLEDAAYVGQAMAKANDLAKRSTEPYWEGANWKIALGLDPTQRMENYDQLDERAEWMYEAVSTSAGMVTTTPGVGSIYLASYADKDGDWLQGDKSYTLHVPANPPAAQFWSIAVYSWDSRTLINNPQERAGQSSREDLIKNSDGSFDLYFGPEAPEGKEKNWVQTIPGQGWWVYLRFYAPTKEYFDKTWSMGDFEKMDQ